MILDGISLKKVIGTASKDTPLLYFSAIKNRHFKHQPWTNQSWDTRKTAVRETKESTNHLKELVHAHRGIVDMSLGIYLKFFLYIAGDGMEMALLTWRFC